MRRTEVKEEEAREKLTPWEQHSTVISIPRFDYKAPSSLVEHSHSGFLITCTINLLIYFREMKSTWPDTFLAIIGYYVNSACLAGKNDYDRKFIDEFFMVMYVGFLLIMVMGLHFKHLMSLLSEREKSATKEAISILQKYISPLSSDSVEVLEPVDENVSVKRRKISSDEADGKDVESASSEEGANVSGISGEEAKDVPPKTDAEIAGPSLSLVKLTRSGLLLFTFPKKKSLHSASILANIFESMDSGSLKPPVWCHRILPFQATCILKEKELQMAVSRLVQEYLNDERNKYGRPIRFAVGYNRRGIDETEMKVQKNASKDSHEVALLDRNKCFSIVAEVVKDIAVDSVVDLKSPELAVLVELLPLSGVANSSSVAALSILPHNLITVKPRLCVKALVSNANARGGKNKKQ